MLSVVSAVGAAIVPRLLVNVNPDAEASLCAVTILNISTSSSKEASDRIRMPPAARSLSTTMSPVDTFRLSISPVINPSTASTSSVESAANTEPSTSPVW